MYNYSISCFYMLHITFIYLLHFNIFACEWIHLILVINFSISSCHLIILHRFLHRIDVFFIFILLYSFPHWWFWWFMWFIGFCWIVISSWWALSIEWLWNFPNGCITAVKDVSEFSSAYAVGDQILRSIWKVLVIIIIRYV